MAKRVIHLRGSSAMLGAERVVLELARGSPRFGYQSMIVAPQPPEAPEPALLTLAREAGVPTRVLRCRGRFDRHLFTELRRLAREEGAALIHSHGYKEDFYAALAGTGLPLVATNHNWTRSTALLRAYRRLDGLLLRRFDRVVAVSRPLADELASLGVERRRLHRIGNGIDLADFPPQRDGAVRERLRREFGCGDRTLLLGMISGLRPEKGHSIALRALAELDQPQVRLLVVGDGRERTALHNECEALGLAERVVFAGQREDIAGILQSLDVFLMPSLTEGLPMALLEAMAAGLPAIASRVGDIPRVLDEGRCGILTDPGSVPDLVAALGRLIADPGLGTKLGRSARTRVEQHYSAASMTAAYCALYDELLSASAPSPRAGVPAAVRPHAGSSR